MPPTQCASCRAAVTLVMHYAIALAAFAALSTTVAAQENASDDLLTSVRALGLPSATDRITVHYEAGSEAKALRLRALVQDALQFFADSLGVTPELSLAVLGRSAWERTITWQPYGIPGVAGRPPVAFLPATDDNLAANDALGLEAGISDSARALVAAAGHSWPDASRRYADLVGLHEMGHVFAGAYGIRTGSRWFDEWLATYFCYTYLRAKRPADARLWEGILRGYTDAVDPTHRTIDAFERLYFGVGALNYVWYQARFQEQVAAVHDQHGVQALRLLREAFAPDAPVITSQDALLLRLNAIVPGFSAWGERMR